MGSSDENSNSRSKVRVVLMSENITILTIEHICPFLGLPFGVVALQNVIFHGHFQFGHIFTHPSATQQRKVSNSNDSATGTVEEIDDDKFPLHQTFLCQKPLALLQLRTNDFKISYVCRVTQLRLCFNLGLDPSASLLQLSNTGLFCVKVVRVRVLTVLCPQFRWPHPFLPERRNVQCMS